MPKEIRQIDLKRKQIIKHVQKTVLLKNKRSAVYSPKSSRSSRNQSDSENNSPARIIRLPQTNRSLHTPQKVDNVIEENSRLNASNSSFKPEEEINTTQSKGKYLTNHEENEKSTGWLEEKKQLEGKVQELKRQLENKEKSIKMLNNLIGNEEEELSYRENEVEMLENQIKKLINYRKDEHPNLIHELNIIKNELSLRDKSIRSLNALIANEVQILTEEIHKMMKWKNMYEEQKKKYEKCVQDLKQRQKSIKQLSKLIGNEQQELSFRESQVEVDTLSKEIRRLQNFSKKCYQFEEKIQKIEEENKELINAPRSYDEQLVSHIVELQVEVSHRNEDIITLSNLLREIGSYAPPDQVEGVKKILSKLKTVSLM